LTPGTVYLVGAGPGDPGLITARGLARLGAADVVVYDRLVHPDMLRHARFDAERVYAGKESARHTLTQDEINAVIVDRALAGKNVCRLKGGDPFVFGRGGEEAEACVASGVPFEVVPGVTSAIAAPAYAGIPVTHRDAASSFAVITGHEREPLPPTPSPEGKGETAGKAEGRRDWARIAHAADTLVFLMGVESLDQIAARLIEHGRSAETPVALVAWGTWPAQRTLVSTLGSVVEDARRDGFKPPAVTVVGEVVRLRDTLRWFDTQPLFGKRVLVTRAREQASALSDLLRDRGAEPVEFPVIRIEAVADNAALDAAVARIGEYQWVAFTSANGVRSVAERLAAAGRDARAFGTCRIAAIGPATADALREIGLRADFVPSEYVAEAVAAEWPDREMAGKRVLLPRAEEAREALPERLREMGAKLDVVAAYRTVRDAGSAVEVVAALESGAIHAVTFTSSSTVRNFVESVGAGSAAALLRGVCVASIGPITSATARELGIEPDIEAAEHTIPGLVEALVSRELHVASRA
jgi:uroporphyrinogen III methyltransferase / synthase